MLLKPASALGNISMTRPWPCSEDFLGRRRSDCCHWEVGCFLRRCRAACPLLFAATADSASPQPSVAKPRSLSSGGLRINEVVELYAVVIKRL